MIIDFESHNVEVTRVWEAFHAGVPIRPPMILGTNPRYTMSIPEANPKGITFQEYLTDPDKMVQRQLGHIWWLRHNLVWDTEMGPPKDGFHLYIDFQNVYEAAWFGSEIYFDQNQVPDTLPLLSDDNKETIFDAGLPDPFTGGLMRRNWEFYEHINERIKAGLEYRNLPVLGVTPAGLGTDGPMTVCCNLRGADGFCADLAGDPDYADQLLSFVTEATITRIRAYRRHLGHDVRPQGLGFADDSIQLISTSMYEDRIMPHHKLLIDELSQGGPNSIHLCGNAARHFPLIADKLAVTGFDTGFPVDFEWLDKALPKSISVNGGPSVPMMAAAQPGEIREEVKRILSTGIARDRRFVLREGNNLPPNVSPKACLEMYEAVREFGAEYV